MSEDNFEKHIKPILLYIGTIVAIIMAIAYIIAVVVLIIGFKQETVLNTTLFAIVNAGVGFCIMQMLKIQGQSFAENLEANKPIIREYYGSKTKDKKSHSMKYYWITSIIKDTFSKCLTLALNSVGLVYIIIEGSNDYNLLILAFVNLLMFAGFGMVALVKTYDFYNNSYISYMKEKIDESKKRGTQINDNIR